MATGSLRQLLIYFGSFCRGDAGELVAKEKIF
jgi:hypothetical protein